MDQDDTKVYQQQSDHHRLLTFDSWHPCDLSGQTVFFFHERSTQIRQARRTASEDEWPTDNPACSYLDYAARNTNQLFLAPPRN